MAKKNINEEFAEFDQEIEEAKKPEKIDKTSDEYLNQLVPVKLVKDKQHTRDQIVRVNGYAYQIQRGKTVLVPRFVKEVLDNAERQAQEALERSQELQINPNDLAFK